MSVLNIKFYPDPVLREPTASVEEFDQALIELVSDMFETMDDSNGVGLAAPQIGLSKKILVVGFEEERFELINPVLSEFKGNEAAEEGCLSLPGVQVSVDRATSIRVDAKNKQGEPLTFTAHGFVARIIQHEVDHLNGALIIDKGNV